MKKQNEWVTVSPIHRIIPHSNNKNATFAINTAIKNTAGKYLHHNIDNMLYICNLIFVFKL